MKNYKTLTIVEHINRFHYGFNPQLRKRLTAINDKPALIKEISYIETIARGNCVLAGREERVKQRHKIKALKNSEATLKQANDLTIHVERYQEAEILHYYNARHLQLFFNNSDNWDTWENELQRDNDKLQGLKALRNKWFSQQAFAIYPTKLLSAVQERLDNIRQYMANWRLDLELNRRRLSKIQKEAIQNHLEQLENYADSVSKQLFCAAALRLEAGIFLKNPTRDNTVNYFLEQLHGLGISNGKLSDVTESDKTYKTVLEAGKKSKQNKAENPVKAGKEYTLAVFSPKEIYQVDNGGYNALHVMASEEKGYLSRIKMMQRTSISKSPLIVLASTELNPVFLIAPKNITVPRMRPRFPALFSTETFKYDFLKLQQLTLAEMHLTEENTMDIKFLDFSSDFEKTPEKLLYNDICRLRSSLMKQMEINEKIQKKYNSIFYFRRNAYLNEFKTAYTKLLGWIDGLLKNWFKNVITPAIEHIVLTQDDAIKQKKYYEKVLALLNDAPLPTQFVTEAKKVLESKIKQKSDSDSLRKTVNEMDDLLKDVVKMNTTLSREVVDDEIFLKQMADKKAFDGNEILRITALLPLIFKSKESAQQHTELLKQLFRHAKRLINKVNTDIYSHASSPNEELNLLAQLIPLLGKVDRKGKEMPIESYTKLVDSVVKKLLHLHINVLKKWDYPHDTSNAEKHPVINTVKRLLDNAKQSLCTTVVFDNKAMGIDEFLFQVNYSAGRINYYAEALLKNTSDGTKHESPKVMHKAYQERYQRYLDECQQTLNTAVLRKKLEKLFLTNGTEEKCAAERDIEDYLKNVAGFDRNLFQAFEDLKYSAKIAPEDILNNSQTQQKAEVLISLCPQLPAMVALARCVDDYHHKFSKSGTEMKSEELQAVLEKFIKLTKAAFPVTGGHTFNGQFFSQKFGMAAPELDFEPIQMTNQLTN